MSSGFYIWSQTAASNGSADSTVNFAEGQAPSSVNDSARALMAGLAKMRDDQAGSLTTGGSSTAYTLTTNSQFDTLAHLSGQTLKVKFNATNGASPTLNVDSLGAKAIHSVQGTAIGTGAILANSIWDVTYDNSNSCFVLSGGQPVQTTAISDAAVTLPKLAAQADGTIVGNISGSSASPVALTLSGFTKSGTTVTAPVPVPAAFKNLSIKVATNTTVALAADFIAVTDGTSFQTLAFSSTINLGTTGANALDTGTIAIDTWYYIWAIAKADGTAAGLASASATAPTMPSGYTYKARVGAVQTIHGSATLYGTWQFGRRARYIFGVGQTGTGNYPSMGTTASATWAAFSNVRFVPTTASFIDVNATNSASATIGVAGNNSGASSAASSEITTTGLSTPNGATGSIMIQSSSIYAFTNAGTLTLAAMGWEDNI